MMTHLCLADIAGPFYDPDKPFRNWSALPFYQLDLARPPYVDLAQLEHGLIRASAYLEQIHTQGYTGIVIDNLAHLVGFQRAPSRIYPVDNPYATRARIYQEAFGRLFDRAAGLGMDVFVTTDMQWSTPPLRRWAGHLSPNNPRLADLNRWALEELFATFPHVRGVFIRIGEAGGAHNQALGYASQMLYTATDALRGLIGTLLPICERYDRFLIVRTWSVGAGELGDLLWSRERYRAVFEGFDSPTLLASIKHGPADFFRLLPHNPTLGLPGPRQLVEVQNRREYELFGMVPSSVARLHQDVLQYALRENSRFAGIWAWNGTGGWGGGSAALGERGWSGWTDLNSALTAALLRDPALITESFVRQWWVGRIGARAAAALADAFLESETLFERAWYSGMSAADARAVGAIVLPPLLWIWWMRPTASLAIWAYLASVQSDRAGIERDRSVAVARARWHADRLGVLLDDADAPLAESLRYMSDVFATAHAIRSLMEALFGAAWDGQRSRWDALATEVPGVRAELARHCASWLDNAAFPPLELAEIAGFLGELERAPGRLWLQARVVCLLVARLRGARWRGRRLSRAHSVVAILLFVAALNSREGLANRAAHVLVALLLASPLRRRALAIGLSWLSRRYYLLPSIFFETGPPITEWMA